jgi:hypothetical protein
VYLHILTNSVGVGVGADVDDSISESSSSDSRGVKDDVDDPPERILRNRSNIARR